MKKILFFVCTLLCANVLLAQTFWDGDIEYLVISTNPAEVEVNGAYNSITTANIPAVVTYNETNYSVTSIGGGAFYGCGSLSSITIPNSVTEIENSAFYYCISLTSVTCLAEIPPYLAHSVFASTPYDKTLTYPCGSDYSSWESATDWASVGCTLDLGNSLTSFHLTFAIISEEERTMKVSACDASATVVDVPASVMYNGKVYNVTSIGSNAFYNCSSLTSVDIPNSVTSIGTWAFASCNSLTSVTIPNSVTSIGTWAFYNCSSLTSINIPNSVTSIGNYAFYGCSSLTSVNIPNSVTSIGNYAFSHCSSLTSVDIPNSVTSIGKQAFAYCSSLTSVTIPNSVTSIGNSAFADCSSLTSVTIPNSVTSIGSGVFMDCSSLTSVTIPNSVTSIDGAFWGCSSLTSVNIPNSVTSIGNNAFRLCDGLTSVTIPNSVTSIGDYAFYDCDGLTSVTIPNSVTSIGEDAFYGCSSLTSVTIGNSVTSIGTWTFGSCSSLTYVTIPNSVTSIGNYAFYGCSSLTSVTIPNSVTSIGNEAFSYCSSLDSITCLAETAPSLGNNVFYNTPSDATLTVPFNASGYTSDWGNATWQKIYHKINKEETKTLTNAFEITEANKRQIINEGVLRIKQGGQLINQTATNVEGIIEIEAINRENNWNYIGAPFANNYQLGAILPQSNDVSVSIFNHSTGSWSSEWATYDDVINTGESFAAWNWGASPITFTTYGDIWNYETNQAGKYNFAQDPTYTLNNQDEITISHQDNNSEDNVNWLSVANPYTFKLDIAQIRTDNELQGDVLYTYNGTTFQPVETGEISVTEGFFVNNTTLKFKKGQRKTNIAKSTKQKDYIKLIMTDTDTQAELLFTQNDKANANYDRFDANKLFSPKEITEPYFVTDGQALVKEEVKELPYTATLNIKSYENKDITIKITNIPEGVNVYLLDNDQDTKMNGDVEYTTNITAGENSDRFKILFKPQQKLETKQNNHITINNHNRHITITSTITDLHIEVYNTLGQKVHTTKDYTFTLDHLPSGSYLIKAFKGRQTKTEKIVIE